MQSVSYKSAQIILNGTIILCNLSFVFQFPDGVREMVEPLYSGGLSEKEIGRKQTWKVK